MRLHHTFDWDGFTFFGKLLFVVMVLTGGSYFSLLYATGSHATSASPSLVLIQETRPAPTKSLSLTLGTTTSEHIINTLSIADAVPPAGKFIAVDLTTWVLTLYQDGTAIAKYPIHATAKIGSPYETPAGFYTVLVKEPDHFNSEDRTHLPWSIQFYGNYLIHGWPSLYDGSLVDSTYTGGNIRLSTDDAVRVYAFADIGTGIFVYDPIKTASMISLVLDALPTPSVSAASYMVADIDTGDVLLEQNTEKVSSIAPVTTLMAALVANETMPFNTKDTLTQVFSTTSFIGWMNAKAKALDMQSTLFANAVSTSTLNVSTPDDLFRFVTYLVHRKSFILDTTPVTVENTMLSVVSVPINGVERRVAIIVLKSNDSAADIKALTDWFTTAAQQGATLANTACITCALPPPYRKIQL